MLYFYVCECEEKKNSEYLPLLHFQFTHMSYIFYDAYLKKGLQRKNLHTNFVH